MFFAGIYALAVLNDLLQTILAKSKDKEYQWKSNGIFTDSQSLISVIVMTVMLISGVYGFYIAAEDSIEARFEQVEVKCDRCGSMFPEEYETRDSWDTICPHCTNKEINSMVRMETSICIVCERQYELSKGEHGMCWDCYLDESAECNWCGNPAPHELTDGDGFFLCTECMGELMAEKSVMKAVWKVLDS